MCGTVGIVSNTPQTRRGWLAIGRDAMTHRGPDDAGEWWSADGRVGLAQRRLAIIDLSPAGHQPMHDAAGTLSIPERSESSTNPPFWSASWCANTAQWPWAAMVAMSCLVAMGITAACSGCRKSWGQYHALCVRALPWLPKSCCRWA